VRLRVAAPAPGRRDGCELLVGTFQSLYDLIASRRHSRLITLYFKAASLCGSSSFLSISILSLCGLIELDFGTSGRRRQTYESETFGSFIAEVSVHHGVVSTTLSPLRFGYLHTVSIAVSSFKIHCEHANFSSNEGSWKPRKAESRDGRRSDWIVVCRMEVRLCR
jgi:hypothetical protein